MATVISIMNNKGGVGKTTTTAFMGELLSLFGKKVLLVDTDESGNLSLLFKSFQEDSSTVLNGIEQPSALNVTELFRFRYREAEHIEKCIYAVQNNLDIIPASKRLSLIPDQLLLQAKSSNLNNNIILKRALSSIADRYDYIIIDTAPRNDILIVNSLMASDYVLIPVRSEAFSMKGFKEVLTRLSELKEEFDISAEFLGTFQVAAETSTNVFKELDAAYKEMLGEKSLPCIRKDVKVNEILSMSDSNLITYTARSNVLYDYCMLLLSLHILDGTTERLIKRSYGMEEQ